MTLEDSHARCSKPNTLPAIKVDMILVPAATMATQRLCHRLEVEAGWYAVLRVPALGSAREPGPHSETLTFAQALNRALRKILAERPESLMQFTSRLEKPTKWRIGVTG